MDPIARQLTNKHPQPTAVKSAFTMVELVVVLAIIGILMSLVLSGVQSAREAARRTNCSNNLHQLVLALHQFHNIHDALPLGNDRWQYRNQAWSSAILGPLEQPAIAERWDRQVAWDDPQVNAELGQRVIPTFRCPTSILDVPGDTDYAGIAGSALAAERSNVGLDVSNGVLITSTPRRLHPVTLTEIVDGTSYTLCLAEVVDRLPESHGLWADGANVISHDNGGINVDNSGEIFSFHPGGAQVAFSDGAVQFLTESMDKYLIGALCSRNGHESVADAFKH
jgi:prepilin-type N-terminal cleavage/methylation domain-containing protein/prepilin-type processing-associated H-X9-DG protein